MSLATTPHHHYHTMHLPTPPTAPIPLPLAPATTRSFVVLAEGQLDLQWTSSAREQGVWSALRLLPGSEATARRRYTATFTWAEVRCRPFLRGQQANPRQTAELDAILAALNASRLSSISFLYDPHPNDELYAAILAHLDIPSLRHLWLGARPSVSALPHALAFLSSPRAAGLSFFSLDFEPHSERDVDDIARHLASAELDMGRMAEDSCAPQRGEYKRRRLVGVLEENGERKARVKDAVRRALVPARVLLRGRPPSVDDEESAHDPHRHRPFRILDLPRELLYAVIEHASGDPRALSATQWAKFHTHAADAAGLVPLARGFAAVEADPRVGRDAGWDEWLHNGGFWWDEGSRECRHEAISRQAT